MNCTQIIPVDDEICRDSNEGKVVQLEILGNVASLIGGRVYTIGRGETCNIHIDDLTVSTEHACIETDGRDTHEIWDSGSSNGTFVRNRRLKPNVRYFIEEGDQLKFGDVCGRIKVVAENTQIGFRAPSPVPIASARRPTSTPRVVRHPLNLAAETPDTPAREHSNESVLEVPESQDLLRGVSPVQMEQNASVDDLFFAPTQPFNPRRSPESDGSAPEEPEDIYSMPTQRFRPTTFDDSNDVFIGPTQPFIDSGEEDAIAPTQPFIESSEEDALGPTQPLRTDLNSCRDELLAPPQSPGSDRDSRSIEDAMAPTQPFHPDLISLSHGDDALAPTQLFAPSRNVSPTQPFISEETEANVGRQTLIALQAPTETQLLQAVADTEEREGVVSCSVHAGPVEVILKSEGPTQPSASLGLPPTNSQHLRSFKNSRRAVLVPSEHQMHDASHGCTMETLTVLRSKTGGTFAQKSAVESQLTDIQLIEAAEIAEAYHKLDTERKAPSLFEAETQVLAIAPVCRSEPSSSSTSQTDEAETQRLPPTVFKTRAPQTSEAGEGGERDEIRKIDARSNIFLEETQLQPKNLHTLETQVLLSGNTNPPSDIGERWEEYETQELGSMRGLSQEETQILPGQKYTAAQQKLPSLVETQDELKLSQSLARDDKVTQPLLQSPCEEKISTTQFLPTEALTDSAESAMPTSRSVSSVKKRTGVGGIHNLPTQPFTGSLAETPGDESYVSSVRDPLKTDSLPTKSASQLHGNDEQSQAFIGKSDFEKRLKSREGRKSSGERSDSPDIFRENVIVEDSDSDTEGSIVFNLDEAEGLVEASNVEDQSRLEEEPSHLQVVENVDSSIRSPANRSTPDLTETSLNAVNFNELREGSVTPDLPYGKSNVDESVQQEISRPETQIVSVTPSEALATITTHDDNPNAAVAISKSLVKLPELNDEDVSTQESNSSSALVIITQDLVLGHAETTQNRLESTVAVTHGGSSLKLRNSQQEDSQSPAFRIEESEPLPDLYEMGILRRPGEKSLTELDVKDEEVEVDQKKGETANGNAPSNDFNVSDNLLSEIDAIEASSSSHLRMDDHGDGNEEGQETESVNVRVPLPNADLMAPTGPTATQSSVTQVSVVPESQGMSQDVDLTAPLRLTSPLRVTTDESIGVSQEIDIIKFVRPLEIESSVQVDTEFSVSRLSEKAVNQDSPSACQFKLPTSVSPMQGRKILATRKAEREVFDTSFEDSEGELTLTQRMDRIFESPRRESAAVSPNMRSDEITLTQRMDAIFASPARECNAVVPLSSPSGLRPASEAFKPPGIVSLAADQDVTLTQMMGSIYTSSHDEPEPLPSTSTVQLKFSCISPKNLRTNMREEITLTQRMDSIFCSPAREPSEEIVDFDPRNTPVTQHLDMLFSSPRREDSPEPRGLESGTRSDVVPLATNLDNTDPTTTSLAGGDVVHKPVDDHFAELIRRKPMRKPRFGSTTGNKAMESKKLILPDTEELFMEVINIVPVRIKQEPEDELPRKVLKTIIDETTESFAKDSRTREVSSQNTSEDSQEVVRTSKRRTGRVVETDESQATSNDGKDQEAARKVPPVKSRLKTTKLSETSSKLVTSHDSSASTSSSLDSESQYVRARRGRRTMRLSESDVSQQESATTSGREASSRKSKKVINTVTVANINEPSTSVVNSEEESQEIGARPVRRTMRLVESEESQQDQETSNHSSTIESKKSKARPEAVVIPEELNGNGREKRIRKKPKKYEDEDINESAITKHANKRKSDRTNHTESPSKKSRESKVELDSSYSVASSSSQKLIIRRDSKSTETTSSGRKTRGSGAAKNLEISQNLQLPIQKGSRQASMEPMNEADGLPSKGNKTRKSAPVLSHSGDIVPGRTSERTSTKRPPLVSTDASCNEVDFMDGRISEQIVNQTRSRVRDSNRKKESLEDSKTNVNLKSYTKKLPTIDHGNSVQQEIEGGRSSRSSIESQSSTRRRGCKAEETIKITSSPLNSISSPRRVSQQKFHVAFTGYDYAADQDILLRLGGQITESAVECTVLVTDRVRRTCKFLCAVGRGKPIVSPQWLHESRKFKTLLDPQNFIIEDRDMQSKYSFDLRWTLSAASRNPLLTGQTVVVTSSVKPPPTDIKQIIECAGGRYLEAKHMPRSTSQSTWVISCPEDKHFWPTAKKLGIKVVAVEALLSGLLKHHLELAPYELR